jgi:hypothetical protein
MSMIDVGNPSPIEQGDVKHVDIKQPPVQVQTAFVDTPAQTPNETPVDDNDAMAGKKVFSTEKPDDRARELAKSLTLEEQVRLDSDISKRLDPHDPEHVPLKDRVFTLGLHCSAGEPINGSKLRPMDVSALGFSYVDIAWLRRPGTVAAAETASLNSK